MATANTRMFENFRGIAVNAWDWPDLPGSKFTDDDRVVLRRLSQYFSTASGIAVAALSVASDHQLPVTVGLSAVAVVAGHYMAGAVQDRRVRRRQHETTSNQPSKR